MIFNFDWKKEELRDCFEGKLDWVPYANADASPASIISTQAKWNE